MVEARGELQLSGAIVSGIEIKSVEGHFDYITILLESPDFVELLGSNRIRLVFSGCSELRCNMSEGPKETLRSFYVRDSSNDHGRIRYGVELNESGTMLEIMSRAVQVQVEETTHSRH